MTPQELRKRFFNYARHVVELATPATECRAIASIATQLIRSATSASANYRAAGRSRSHAEFCAKISVALEETDESLHWLEMLQGDATIDAAALAKATKEAGELTAILAKSRQTAYRNRADDKRRSGRPTFTPPRRSAPPGDLGRTPGRQPTRRGSE
jgi:four helix bundle protein